MVQNRDGAVRKTSRFCGNKSRSLAFLHFRTDMLCLLGAKPIEDSVFLCCSQRWGEDLLRILNRPDDNDSKRLLLHHSEA